MKFNLPKEAACKLTYPIAGPAHYNYISSVQIKLDFQSPISVVANSCPATPNTPCNDNFLQSGQTYTFKDCVWHGNGTVTPEQVTVLVTNYNGVSDATINAFITQNALIRISKSAKSLRLGFFLLLASLSYLF